MFVLEACGLRGFQYPFIILLGGFVCEVGASTGYSATLFTELYNTKPLPSCPLELG